MARVDARFILRVAFDAATANSEGPLSVWAERHDIDPGELVSVVKMLTGDIFADIEEDKEGRAAYFLQLGYEIRRRQHG